MAGKNYREGNVKGLVGAIIEAFALDRFKVQQLINEKFPQLKTIETCANCGASMLEYEFRFDVLSAVLLIKMAEKVRSAIEKGMQFTEANMVHIPSMDTITHAIKCRTTWCAKLGLVAKVMSGKHQVPGMWLITTRGWVALRGEQVPAKVVVFRNRIEERFDDKTTIPLIFANHREFVNERKRKNEPIQNDYTHIAYHPSEWVRVAGIHGGEVI